MERQGGGCVPRRAGGAVTGTEIVQRAVSAMGHEFVYALGHGGWHPEDPLPTRDLSCDCTGFVSWCLGVCRQCPDVAFPWYETTAIAHDAIGDQRHFIHVRWQDAVIGDVVVYGDRKDAEGHRHQGHIGVISAVDLTGPLKVIHCSKGACQSTGDAIAETSPELWRVRGIVARHQERIA